MPEFGEYARPARVSETTR